MRIILTTLLLAILAGCATTPPTAEQLVSMTDGELCETAYAWPDRLDVIYVMLGRGLTCHPRMVDRQRRGGDEP